MNPRLRMLLPVGLLVMGVGTTQLMRYLGSSPDAGEDLAATIGDVVGTDVAPEVAADRALNAKLGNYIDHCTNHFSRSVGDAMARYASWIADPAVGPTGDEQSVSGIGQINADASQCVRAVERANALEPRLPALEAAATGYAEALVAVAPLVAQAHTYYQRHNYRDDGFAGAKRMHGPLWAALTNFVTARDLLGAQLRPLNRALSERRVERLAAEPSRELEANVERHILLAQDILEQTENWSVSDGQLAGIAVEPFVASVETLETLTDTLKAAVDAGAGQAAVASTVPLGIYMERANDLLVAAKAVMRRMRDQEAFSDIELRQLASASGSVVRGSPFKMMQVYNQMVGAYNGLRWRR